MNWNSKAVSEVAKERIWKEHVATERSKVRIFDQFRKNPHRVAHDKPLSDPINRRSPRFLDRERAFLDTIERRVASHRPDTTEDTTSGHHEPVTLPPIGSARRGVPQPPHEQRPTPRRAVETAQKQRTPEELPPAAQATTAAQAVAAEEAHTPRPPATARSGDNFDFGAMWSQMQSPPIKKYETPMTEAQELGWLQPGPAKPRDPRFVFNHRSTEMTRFARSLQRAKPQK